MSDALAKQATSGNAAAATPPEVIPFPIGRRRKLIARVALAMKRKKSDCDAEMYLASQMRVQLNAMRRKGVPLGVVKKQLHAMEAAVRGELWRLILGPQSGGDAA